VVAPGPLERLAESSDRRGGAFVYGNGMSSIATMPGLSGVGPAMAAARNYIFTLHEETKARGVYVGAVTIGATIQSSGIRQLMEAKGQLMNVPTVSPDEIADDVWSMVTQRNRVETVITGQR
jgi:NADP-dependent 3-hydroxy acid dehydrogenase YdfG